MFDQEKLELIHIGVNQGISMYVKTTKEILPTNNLCNLLFIATCTLFIASCDNTTNEKNNTQTGEVKNIASPAYVSEARQATTRLLIGSEPGFDSMGVRLAGLEIDLKDGWKTYWRSPGDSGVPPKLDWSKSKNVKKVEVKWPAPKRFKDVEGDSVGYKDSVILPILVTPEDSKAPVELNLSLFYGVCSDICVPVNAKLKQTLAVTIDKGDVRIVEALESVPIVWDQDAFKISKINTSDDGKKLTISASYPSEEKADMFVERVDGKYLPIAHKKSSIGTDFEFELPTSAPIEAGTKLRITMVAANQSAEIETTFNK